MQLVMKSLGSIQTVRMACSIKLKLPEIFHIVLGKFLYK